MDLRPMLRRVSALEIGVYAANASFFILLSVFPGMLLVIGLLPYTPIYPEDLERAVASILPPALYPLLDYMVRQLFVPQIGSMVPFSALAALWTASKGVYSLSRGLNRVYRVRETRSILALRLRYMGFTLAMVAALFLTILAHLFSRELAQMAQGRGNGVLRAVAAVLRMRYLTIVSLLTLLFAGLYTVFPNKKIRFTASLPGAFGAAVAWVVFSQVYSFYVTRFGHYSFYYGSLSVIALAMLWLYACMCILFYGGLLNRWLSELRR